MKTIPTARALGLLLSLGLPLSSAAQDAPQDESAWGRLPQVAVEVGGSWSRIQHPGTYVPTSRDLVRWVDGRVGAARLSGGLHFNILRGSQRDDLWWTNGVDWYLTGDVEVLAFRPGLEKRFKLGKRLTLGVSAFGGAAEVSVPTGRITQDIPNDPNGAPQYQPRYYEAKSKKWIFGAGAAGSLQANFGRFVYTRVQAGYTQYFKRAEDFAVSSDLQGFSVSLSGPWAGAAVGVNL
jgi:hypothetical protein